jgi:methyltransferase (TIGR00027 family)
MACRKRYIDDNLAAALAEIDAVVILGAGLDTRPYRLARRSQVPVFEVDLPINIARKQAIVARAVGSSPESVHLVPVDFERDDLMAALGAHGYDAKARTFFVWEGVTQYLTESAVDATLVQLAGAPSGSKLDFTYVRREFIDGTDMYGAPGLYRRFRKRSRIWKFGLRPGEVEEFVTRFGWRLVEQVGPEEFLDRYVRPAGRDLPTSQLEWSVYAEKP